MKRAMGRVNSWGQIAFVISPIIGALIIGDASEEQFIPAIALTVVALLIGLLVSLSLREPVVDSSEKKASSTTLFRDGVSLLLNSRPLRWLVLLVVFTSPLTSTLATTLGPPYLVQNDVTPFVVGVVLSLGSLLAAFTQRYAYRWKHGWGEVGRSPFSFSRQG